MITPLYNKHLALYRKALARLGRSEEETVGKKELLDAMTAEAEVNVEREKRRIAKEAYDALRKPNMVPGDGQLELPGLDKAYTFEPSRLIDDGRVVVQRQFATLEMKIQELRRARKNANEANLWLNRYSEEVELQTTWTLEEMAKGRASADLLWGNCAKETGVWKPTPPPQEPRGDDEQDDDQAGAAA